MFSKPQTHLLMSGYTLNSRRKHFKCTTFRPCKRMTCLSCRDKRRSYFIRCGVEHSAKNKLSMFVTVSWMTLDKENSWMELVSVNNKLSKLLSGIKTIPFIRVISLGEHKQTPHAHFIVSGDAAKLVRQVSKNKWREKVRVHTEKIKEIEHILGYLFDRNYIPSQLDPTRIKRTRIITASRPMKCGFPGGRSKKTRKTIQKASGLPSNVANPLPFTINANLLAQIESRSLYEAT